MKTVIFIAAIFAVSILASAQQTPQYSMTVNSSPPQITWNSGGPLGAAYTGARTQVLYYPSEFPTTPAGLITRLYLKAGADVPNTYFHKNLLISMGYKNDEPGEDTMSFRTSPPYNLYPVDTIFFSAHYVINAPIDSGDWVPFTLTKPFYYNGLKNFIVDIMHDSSDMPLFGLRLSGFSDNLPGNRSYVVGHQYTPGQGWSWVNTAPINFVQLIGFDITPTGIQDNVEAEMVDLQIYPNPARDEVTLTLSSKERFGALKISLIDLMGTKLLEKECQNMGDYFNYEIDISHFTSGIYFVEIVAGKEKMVKKLVIH